MPNPLYTQLGGNTPQFSNMANMINSFNQFRSNFRGDPRAQVQQLLASGRMSQAQYNQLSQMATQFMRLLK